MPPRGRDCCRMQRVPENSGRAHAMRSLSTALSLRKLLIVFRQTAPRIHAQIPRPWHKSNATAVAPGGEIRAAPTPIDWLQRRPRDRLVPRAARKTEFHRQKDRRSQTTKMPLVFDEFRSIVASLRLPTKTGCGSILFRKTPRIVPAMG